MAKKKTEKKITKKVRKAATRKSPAKGPSRKAKAKAKPKVKSKASRKKTTAGRRAKAKVARPKAAKKKTSVGSARPAAKRVATRRAAPATNDHRASKGLNRRELAQFRTMLLEKRRELIGDVTTLQDEALHKNAQGAAGNRSNMPQHMADIGSDNYEQEFALVLVEGERALLAEIDEALERIGAGTFGICQATGKPIGKARLKAKPWAKYCYEYVLAQELGGYRNRF